MSMKKKTVLLALMLAGVMGLSGCKAWDVVCDVLAVGTTKVEKDNGTKVDLEGKTPEVKDDDSTDLETADSKTTSGNDEKTNDTKKNDTKKSCTVLEYTFAVVFQTYQCRCQHRDSITVSLNNRFFFAYRMCFQLILFHSHVCKNLL